MESPEEQYYRLNRTLLSLIGLWPYDNHIIRQIRFVLSLLILLSFLAVQLIICFFLEHKFDLLTALITSLLSIQWFVKYVSFYSVMKNVKGLREYIRNDWSILEDDEEIEIIRKYTSIGRILTVMIAVTVYLGASTHILIQHIPDLLDIVMPLNESRPRELLILAEYFIDQEKYFYILAIHVSTGILIVATIGVATETFCLLNSIHAFGMFKITSYRMGRILDEDDMQICTEKYFGSYDKIINAVNIHRRVIEFCNLLTTSFGLSYLFMYIITECLTSVCIFTIISIKSQVVAYIKIASFIIVQCVYIFAGNIVGQVFLNSNTHLYRVICNTQWYNAPVKTQKLIFFLIQKTTKDFQVDAGGMFRASLEGLATCISLLFSFYMFLRSV